MALKAHPVYNYAFQVADDHEQTYLSKDESRDGDNVNGKYSYVDPSGALVTVVYRAGADGYTEERSTKEDFVAIRARPINKASVTKAASVSSFQSGVSNTASNDNLVSQVVQEVTPAVERVVTTETTSAGDQGDLVARIISQLTPLIQSTVSSSLATSAGSRGVNQVTTTTTRRVQHAAPAVKAQQQPVRSTASAPVGTVHSTSVDNVFGASGQNNIRFNTPEFQYAFDI